MAFLQISSKHFITSSSTTCFNWARKIGALALSFGLALLRGRDDRSTTARFDIARFGAEVFRPQAPKRLMIVAGTVTLKMAPVLRRLYDQMPIRNGSFPWAPVRALADPSTPIR